MTAFASVGCGKKGPPLPPIIRLPAAPDLTATRRGSIVDLQLTVPGANTDGTRPANIARVEVYGFTDPEPPTEAELLKRATKVASVAVKAPRDPNDTIEPGESDDEVEAPSGNGLDQGAVTHVEDALASPAAAGSLQTEGPLLGPFFGTLNRTYVAVGINTRGRRGRWSKRVAASLLPAPPPPASPTVTYDETAVTVQWVPLVPPAVTPAGDVLPSRPIQPTVPVLGYYVYDASPSKPETRLTVMPVTEARYVDTRIEWGAERCYLVRAVSTVGASSVESDALDPVCRTLVDTFPPMPPRGVTTNPAEGAVSLIWQPSAEKDVAGYIVLRGVAPDGPLAPLFAEPIQDATFTDMVRPGQRYVYAVLAVDRAGNRSEPSERKEDAAR